MERAPLEQLSPGVIAVVCGTRECDVDGALVVHQVLDDLRPAVVVQGGADGVDRATLLWAKSRGVPCATMHAPWEKHGKAGGPIRNGWMLLLRPGCLIALPGNDGTADMVKQARAAGIQVIEPFPGRRAKRPSRR